MEDHQDYTVPVKKIRALIEERDKQILEMDVKIKYYNDAVEAAQREIKQLDKDVNRLAEEDKDLDKELEQLEFIKKSTKKSHEIAIQSLIHHQALERMISKELEAKEQETRRIREEFQTIYNEAKKSLSENPLYKELEKARVDFLKVDIQRRDTQVKIRTTKRIHAKRLETQKKIYYIFFVQIAEDYVTEKKMAELEDLKKQETEAVKKLYTLQEEARMRAKLGVARGEITNMANLTFGSQNCNTKVAKNPEPVQPKEVQQSFQDKLTNIFQQDEPMQMEIPQKIKVIEDKIVMPSFAAPQFTVTAPEKRKSKTVDLSRKWQKMIQFKNSTEHISSQQSDKSLASSQSSQQSVLSQTPQESHILVESPIQNNDPISLEASQKISTTQESVPSQESQKTSQTQNKEKNRFQYKIVESLNTSDELMLISDKTPQTYLSPPQPTNNVKKPRSILNIPENKNGKTQASQEGTSKGSTFGESSKTVRFNLGANHQPKENKGMFGQSMFGNIFGPFFGNPASSVQTTQDDSDTQEHHPSTSFNMSLMDPSCGTPHAASTYDDDGNRSHLRTPEYSYTEENDEPFKVPDIPPFNGAGGGGFFSFGSKPTFSFQ